MGSNDIVMRQSLCLDATPCPLNNAKCIRESALIAQRREVSRVNNTEVAEQLALNHWSRNPTKKRIQQVGALFVEIVRRLHSAHSGQYLSLDSEIPWYEVQLVRYFLISINGFVDRG